MQVRRWVLAALSFLLVVVPAVAGSPPALAAEADDGSTAGAAEIGSRLEEEGFERREVQATDGTVVVVYYQPDYASLVTASLSGLRVAAGMLGEAVGGWPDGQVIVVQDAGEDESIRCFSWGVRLGGGLWHQDKLVNLQLDFALARSLARQWWLYPGRLAERRPEADWLIESLAMYHTLSYFRVAYGIEKTNLFIDASIEKAPNNWLLEMLGYVMGREKLAAVVQEFARQQRGSVEGFPEQRFWTTAEAFAGESLEWFSSGWLQAEEYPDYVIERVASQAEGKKEYLTSIAVRQFGGVPTPVPVQVKLAGDERITLRFEPGRMEQEVRTDKPVESVKVNPNGIILESDDSNNVLISRRYRFRLFLSYVLGSFLWDILVVVSGILLAVFLRLISYRWENWREYRTGFTLVAMLGFGLVLKIFLPYVFPELLAWRWARPLAEAWLGGGYWLSLIGGVIAAIGAWLVARAEKLELNRDEQLWLLGLFWLVIDTLIMVWPWLFA